MFTWAIPFILQALGYLFIQIVVKYIIVRWLAGIIGDFLKWILVRSDRHAVIWAHYKFKAMKWGHNYASPALCQDGACKDYKEDDI